MVVEDDRGENPNALALSEKDLEIREIDDIDIAMDDFPSSSLGSIGKEDPTKFKSEKSGRGPLKEGFQDTCEPVCCVYKVRLVISCQVFSTSFNSPCELDLFFALLFTKNEPRL